MAKCNGAPIFNIMISVKSFTIFESYYVFQIFRQGTGWVTKVWNLKSNFNISKSKKDVLYIMPWKIIEEENQKLKTEIEISLNENWREKSKIKINISKVQSIKRILYHLEWLLKRKIRPNFEGFFDEIQFRLSFAK